MENGIYRVLYRNRTVVLPLLSLSFFFFSFFFLFALSSGFAEMDLGQTGAYPWNGESGAISAGVIAVLREGERKRREEEESVECRERQKQRRTKKEEEEEVVGGRLKKQLFSMRPYHGEFRRRRGNMLGGQQQ